MFININLDWFLSFWAPLWINRWIGGTSIDLDNGCFDKFDLDLRPGFWLFHLVPTVSVALTPLKALETRGKEHRKPKMHKTSQDYGKLLEASTTLWWKMMKSPQHHPPDILQSTFSLFSVYPNDSRLAIAAHQPIPVDPQLSWWACHFCWGCWKISY